MKLLFVLVTIVSLPTNSLARCGYGCYCYNDDACEYFCMNGICQNQLPYGGQCTGYYTHPRECGSLYYCDQSSYPWTCRSLKYEGSYCTADYQCLSTYCDFSSYTCRPNFSRFTWMTPVIVSGVVSSIIFIIVLLLIVRIRQRRRMALAAYSVPCPVVQTPVGVYPSSYQNPCLIGEGAPPKYPGQMNPVASPYPYQSPLTQQSHLVGSSPSYQNPQANHDVPPPAYSP